jgi:hypothetical protein
MHFGVHVQNGEKAASAPEWLGVSAQITTLVNEWAGRGDLVAFVGEKAGQGQAAALYSPDSAEIEVNTIAAFGKAKPRHIGDLNERKMQFEHAKAAGAVYHEAMHAKHTGYDLRKAYEYFEKPSQFQSMANLEESRIETLGVKERPGNKPLLRSCALDIVMADMSEDELKSMTQTRQAAHMASLTLARVDAGVLEESDIIAVRAQIETVLKEDLMKDLRSIWLQFQRIRNTETELQRMYDLAIEWDRLVEEAAEENGEGSNPMNEKGHGAPGMMMPGSGSGEPMTPEEEAAAEAAAEAFGEMMKALAEDAQAAGIDAQSEAQDQQTTEEWQEQAAAAGKLSKEKKEHEEQAAKVFGQGSGPLKARTSSRLIEKRKPTSEERIAAVTVSRELEKAKYSDRVRIETASVMPPGRMRSRAMVQGAAYKAKGLIMQQTEPWRRVQHRHTEDPNLTIGVMVDISGSMSGAMQPMSATAWVMSEAVRRIQATAAMIYFGNDVFPTLHPGQHLDEVNVYSAADGVESFNKGFIALDGELTLLQGSGARLLVVASDGCYGGTNEYENCVKWLKRCRDAGVGVLWIGFGHADDYGKKICQKTGATFVLPGATTGATATIIGHAGAQALTKASEQRNGR